VTVCCVTDAQRAALGRALAGTAAGAEAGELAEAVGSLTAEEVLSLLRASGVPAALSVHPSAVPDDPQVVARDLLRHYRHPAAGRFVQVGIPLSLSVDAPAVKGPAPTPAAVRRRVKRAPQSESAR
jgi:crotonobetainyl-CoA:carnitine CoA-transferase CaiB-like acyl-CoA transferase